MDATGKILFDTNNETLNEQRNSRPEIKAVLNGGNLGSALRKSTTLNEDLYMSHYQSKSGQLSHFTYRRTDKRFYRELRVFAVGSFLLSVFLPCSCRNDLLSDLSKPAIENRAARTKKWCKS